MSSIPKFIGAGAAAILGIDAIKTGWHKGQQRTNAYLADELTDVYIRQQSSPTDSHLYNKIKEWVGQTALDAKYMPILHGLYNGITSSAGQILKYSVPLLMAGGAIAFSGVPVLGWACVAGLLGSAALTILNMGFGLFPNTKNLE